MQLKIDNLVPEPLQSRLAQQPSEVWAAEQSFEPGERVFFRAPSGKGKSTLIHILYGLRQDYTGNAYWDGIAIKNQKAEQWAAWRSGPLSIVFQDLRLFGNLSVGDNIVMKQALQPGTSLERAKEWLAMLGLADKWEQKAETLSYGERQRVAIVRSLLQPFQWLLLDEPFSHLDQVNIDKAVAIIKQRTEELNAGMLVVDLEDNDWFRYGRKVVL